MDILKLQELKFYYKYKNNRLPYYFQSLPFHYNLETHQHNTHIEQNIQVGRTVHEYAKKCIQYDLPVLVNSSPKEILDKIDTHSLRGFAGYIIMIPVIFLTVIYVVEFRVFLYILVKSTLVCLLVDA